MALVTRLLAGKSSMQVSDALTGSINLPSAGLEVGDFQLISSVTLNATQSTVTFGGIPQNFKHLQVRMLTYNTASQGNIYLNINNDSAGNYTYHYTRGNSTSPNSDYGVGNTFAYINYDTNSGSAYAPRIIDILEYANTAKLKTIRSLGGWNSNGSGIVFLQSNLWTKAGSGVTSDAINTLSFSYSAGSFASGSTFSLYGLKG
jgi:hypothetical protein